MTGLPQVPPASVGGSAPDPAAAAGAALELRDIHLPADPGAWPPAPGWWLLAGLVMVLLVAAAVIARRRWLRRRRRQRILAELEQLGGSEAIAPVLAAGISELLKRVALSRYRRAEVASLTGEAWLAFLDRTGGDGRFLNGAGRVLASGPYLPAQGSDDAQAIDSAGLLAAARHWVRRNS
jgi:hypothetical protein